MENANPRRFVGLAILVGWSVAFLGGWLEPEWTDAIIVAGGALLAVRPDRTSIVVIASLTVMVGSGGELFGSDWEEYLGWSELLRVMGYELAWTVSILLFWQTHVMPWGHGRWSQGIAVGLAYAGVWYPLHGFWEALVLSVVFGAMLSSSFGSWNQKPRPKPARRLTPAERIARLRDPDPRVFPPSSDFPRPPVRTYLDDRPPG